MMKNTCQHKASMRTPEISELSNESRDPCRRARLFRNPTISNVFIHITSSGFHFYFFVKSASKKSILQISSTIYLQREIK